MVVPVAIQAVKDAVEAPAASRLAAPNVAKSARLSVISVLVMDCDTSDP